MERKEITRAIHHALRIPLIRKAAVIINVRPIKRTRIFVACMASTGMYDRTKCKRPIIGGVTTERMLTRPRRKIDMAGKTRRKMYFPFNHGRLASSYTFWQRVSSFFPGTWITGLVVFIVLAHKALSEIFPSAGINKRKGTAIAGRIWHVFC